MTLPIRPELLAVGAYGAPQLDVAVRLNTNENPFSPPQALVEDVGAVVAEVVAGLNRYPDRDFMELRQALAEYLSAESGEPVSAAEIWAANGSNEVMQQLLQAVGGPGRKVLVFSPTYSMYEEYARNTHTEFVSVPRRPDFGYDAEDVLAAIERERPTVVFFTSPNNPTGTALADLSLIDTALDALPDGVVVVDEAYAEFRRPGVPSALVKFRGRDNLVVVRTMSKAFAMAGLRLGYAAMSPALIEGILKVRLPYHLSSTTQAVALAALRHARELQADLQVIRDERDSLVDWLRAAGYTAAESDTNFVLFGKFADRHAVWQALVDRGVLIRETGPDGWLRVTVGTPAEMGMFKAALVEVERSGI